jgi:glycosyltransferase involved in cell wall biosynthesis
MFIEHPEWFGFLERLYFQFMRLMRSNVKLVLTSSETEVKRISGVLTKRVPVAAVGLGVETFTQVVSKPIDGLDRGSFLLTVGRLNVRKNLTGSIRAAQLSGRIGPKFPLVVIGNPDGLPPQSADGLSDFVSESVIFLNGIGDNQLKWAYENCAAFVFLSLGEGFGLPPLEAAALGAPIVVSDLPIFRETLRGTVACSWVSPTDPAAGAKAICDALEGREFDVATARWSDNYWTITARYSWAGVVESTRREIQKRV